MIKILAFSTLLTFQLLALSLNETQYNNAKFIYDKTINKNYAAFLIALAFHESSLSNNKIHVCDLKYKNRCYDSVGLFQINLHTALLFEKVNERKLQKKLESRLYNLRFAKRLLKDNNINMIPKSYRNDDISISKRYITKHLQIFNGGAKNKDTNYSNKIYKTYLKVKNMNFKYRTLARR